MNHDAQPASKKPAGTKKTRSPVERIVTWSLITVLLVVVGIEALARFGHSKTVSQLRGELEAVDQGGAELPLAEAQRKVSGLAIKTDHRDAGKGRLTYRWPSLFRSYVLHLGVDGDGNIVTLETDAAGSEESQPTNPAPAAQPGAVDPSAAGAREPNSPAASE